MLKFLSLLAIVFVVAAILIFVTQYSQQNNIKNSPEASTPSWGDGTDSFYQQLITSNGEFREGAGEAIFDNQAVQSISKIKTEGILAQAKQPDSQVLGLDTAPDGSEKWIEVDLSDKKLYAWEGNRKVYEFLVSTGRPGYETPTGEFRVWRKVLSQAYRGGSKARGDYYYLPNVPFSLFWGGKGVPNWKGYAIHGAYWHNDFGIKNRSAGCINMKVEEAGIIYQWAGPAMPKGVKALNTTAENPGVRVVIHK